MIVRDDGDSWQVVLQTDHAANAAAFARAWEGVADLSDPLRRESVLRAISRHDDGWAVSEREAARDGEGRPRNFISVPLPVQMNQYRAAIAAITDVDPFAGLIVSMHGAGLWGGQYGWTMPAPPEAVRPAADAFVAEQESGYAARLTDLGIAEHERWGGFDLLQLTDRISLYFCMQPPVPEARTLERAPRAGSPPISYRLEPVEPSVVSMDPFPFGEAPFRVPILRRVIPKQEFADDDAYREAFAQAPVTPLELTILAA